MRLPKRINGESDYEYNERVSKYLYSKGLSIIEVAAKLGIANTEVYNFISTRRYVTTDEISRIRALFKDGISVSQIARELNISRTTIRRKLAKDSVYDTFTPEDTMAEFNVRIIESMYKLDVPLHEIAKRVNSTPNKVKYRLIRQGIYKSKRISIEEEKEIRKLRKQGLSYRAIAEKIGRSETAVYKHYKGFVKACKTGKK